MAAEDYFVDLFDTYDGDGDPDFDGEVACEHCGEIELVWRQLPNGKWRLWDEDSAAWHKCPPELDFATPIPPN
jgi:hypothetical protein